MTQFKSPFVCASLPPGAMCAPLTRTDRPPAGLSLGLVTAVFCMAEGGKSYAVKHGLDASQVNAELAAVLRNALRQVSC